MAQGPAGTITMMALESTRINLEQLNAALSRTQRLAGIGTLTASVAHELTNPISIITNTCHNLLSQVADDNLSVDELLHYIQMIDQSAWRCARLVQTLRTYTHIDNPQVEPCDLNKMIEDSLTLVAYQFRRQFNVEIETELAPDLTSLRCDPNQITQVLVNLLTNARDAMHALGGTVHITSWAVPEEGAVAFAVRDSGAGIPPELLDRIFEPFFTTKPAGLGTGLGLSIAAGIVQQHHGRITAENNPDGGATFTVILPTGR